MMGQHGGNQDRLFYSFNLESHVPTDHLLRAIDRFLDLSDLRKHLASFYSHTGRPSIDPELMVRMLLVGYCFGIRSERRLCEEVHLNLAYRWFCRLGLEDSVPDHRRLMRWEHEAVLEGMQARLEHDPTLMTIRRRTVEHPFGTIKARMGATHFLCRRLPRVSAEMSLHVLAYNLKRVMKIMGTRPLIEALRA